MEKNGRTTSSTKKRPLVSDSQPGLNSDEEEAPTSYQRERPGGSGSAEVEEKRRRSQRASQANPRYTGEELALVLVKKEMRSPSPHAEMSDEEEEVVRIQSPVIRKTRASAKAELQIKNERCSPPDGIEDEKEEKQEPADRRTRARAKKDNSIKPQGEFSEEEEEIAKPDLRRSGRQLAKMNVKQETKDSSSESSPSTDEEGEMQKPVVYKLRRRRQAKAEVMEDTKEEEEKERKPVLRPRGKLNVKVEVTPDKTEESSDEERTTTVLPVSGKMMGTQIDRSDRIKLEQDSCVIYPYPRYTPFPSELRGRKPVINAEVFAKRKLDLIQDGEVSEEEEEKPKGKVYVVEGVIAIAPQVALLNWKGFKYPSWDRDLNLKNTRALLDFEDRCKIIDPIQMKIRGNMDYLSFLRNYPNAHATQIQDYTINVKNPGFLYLSGLLKLQRHINRFLDSLSGSVSEQTTLLFVDWTTFQDSSIPNFEYISEVEMSPKAAKAIENATSNPSTCIKCINCSGERNGSKDCCTKKSTSKVVYIEKRTLGNLQTPKNAIDEEAPDFIDLYECGDGCKCSRSCMQRAVQNGARLTLVVFRDHLKLWTLRAGCNIKRGTFVCEYTGVMVTSTEVAKGKDEMYQMDLEIKMKTGGSQRMIVDSLEKGNESRFISHSCAPNLFTSRTHFEIAGRPSRHIGLFAGKDIEAGDEITLDYHPEVTDPEEFHELTKSKFTCECGAPNCRETAYQKLIKARKNRK